MLLFLGRCLRCFQGFGSLHGGMEASHPFGPTNEGKRPAKSPISSDRIKLLDRQFLLQSIFGDVFVVFCSGAGLKAP
jgi:hypothetical protein